MVNGLFCAVEVSKVIQDTFTSFLKFFLKKKKKNSL